MPCYDPDDNMTTRAAKVDLLTRLLCEACGKLDALGKLEPATELSAWWVEHQLADRASRMTRKEYERSRLLSERDRIEQALKQLDEEG